MSSIYVKILYVVALGLALAACGGSSSSSSNPDPIAVEPSLAPTLVPETAPDTPEPVVTIPTSEPVVTIPTLDPLAVDVNDLSALADFPVGVALTTYTAGGQTPRTEDIARSSGERHDKRVAIVNQHFNAVSATNAFKMKSLQRNYHEFYFGACDTAFTPRQGNEAAFDPGDAQCFLDFANDNNINDRHMHALLWYRQSPNWLRGGSLQQTLSNLKAADDSFEFDGTADRMEYLHELNYHIDNVVCEYSNDFTSMDVVNEVFSDYGYNGGSNPTGLRNPAFDAEPNPDDEPKRMHWHLQMADNETGNDGSDYIEIAFRRAAAALAGNAPLAENGCSAAANKVDLYLNDYQLVVNSAKRQVFKDYLARWEAAEPRVPIDGVGIQMHYNPDFNAAFTPENVRAGIRDLATTGLKIRILEMDVRGDTDGDQQLSDTEKLAQKDVYQAIIEAYMEEVPPAQKGGVTFWGVSDAQSWLAYTLPLLFDGNLDPKPALQGVADGFAAEYTVPE